MHDARLSQPGLSLPGPFPPHDPLDPVVVHLGTARTSGCLPRDGEGKFRTGIVGRDLTTEEAAECAALCAQNALSLLRAELGSLDRIERHRHHRKDRLHRRQPAKKTGAVGCGIDRQATSSSRPS